MKLSTAVTFLGSAAATFPGASAERVALRGFFHDTPEFLQDSANCASIGNSDDGDGTTITCNDKGWNQCTILQGSGCGCTPGEDKKSCDINPDCISITNNNRAQSVCDARDNCKWTGSNCVSGGGNNRSCKSYDEDSSGCRNTNGCVYFEPSNGEQYFCDSKSRATEYCDNVNYNQCESKGCQWYSNSNNDYCGIPCSGNNDENQCLNSGCVYIQPANGPQGFCDDVATTYCNNWNSSEKCAKKGCVWNSNSLCDIPSSLNADFETYVVSKN